MTTDHDKIADLEKRIKNLEYMFTVLLYLTAENDSSGKLASAKSFLQSIDLSTATDDEVRGLRFRLFEEVKNL